jgi:hypothetical protein
MYTSKFERCDWEATTIYTSANHAQAHNNGKHYAGKVSDQISSAQPCCSFKRRLPPNHPEHDVGPNDAGAFKTREVGRRS